LDNVTRVSIRISEHIEKIVTYVKKFNKTMVPKFPRMEQNLHGCRG
jgi:hypothetical protein